MTILEEFERRIELKKQLIKLTEEQIKELEDELKRKKACKLA